MCIKIMKKSKYIFIALYILAALAVAYFAYGVVKDRYFEAKTVSFDMTNGESPGQADDASADQSGDNLEDNAPVDVPTAVENGQPVFENADCANDCARFKDIPDGLKYCQEACGDRPVTPKESEGQCESLSGVEKDGCWRDLAVSKKDTDICEKIADAKLKRTCRNRVVEEILN